jgi:hypothetical protein
MVTKWTLTCVKHKAVGVRGIFNLNFIFIYRVQVHHTPVNRALSNVPVCDVSKRLGLVCPTCFKSKC